MGLQSRGFELVGETVEAVARAAARCLQPLTTGQSDGQGVDRALEAFFVEPLHAGVIIYADRLAEALIPEQFGGHDTIRAPALPP
jgi:hypothetical protein